MINGKLLIGILINDIAVPNWILKCIENLVQCENARVTVIINSSQEERGCNTKEQSLSLLPARIYEAIDRFLFRRQYDFHRIKDVTSLPSQASIIYRTHYSDRKATQIELGREYFKHLNLDLIILFGNHQLSDEILEIPKYGFWRLSIDNEDVPTTVGYGYKEVVRHLPLTETAIIRVKTKYSAPDILYSSREATYHFSVNINRNKIFWRATHILPRIVEGLSQYGDSYLKKLKERSHLRPLGDNEPYRESFAGILRDLIKHISKLVLLGFNKIIYTDAFSWKLLTTVDKVRNYDDFASFNVIKRPRQRFWADPFVIAADQKYYLFVEDFIYRKNKAHISVLELNSKGEFLRSEKIIERPYHMSYPFTFKEGGSYYMIPETSQNRTIELYKCTGFPYQWKFEGNLMENIVATDTTPFFHENLWWLFTTIDHTNGISGCSTELYLYYSDDLFSGNWTSHPLNPVVSDESNARCAGKLFVEDGVIYRPSQNCSMRYGRRININQVTKLNTDEYNEILVKEIIPDWDRELKGIHTINSEGGLTVIDVYSFHNRLSFK